MIMPHGLKSGLGLGLSISLSTQVLTWLGLGLTNWYAITMNLLVIVFVVYGVRLLWLKNGKSISFLKVVLTVLIIVIISRYVFQLYMFVYTQYIEPEWVEEVSVFWANSLAEQGNSVNTIDNTIKAFKSSYKPINMFTIEIIRYGFFQFILGVLVSLYFVFKKSNKVELK